MMGMMTASEIAAAVGRTRQAVVRAAAAGKLDGAALNLTPQRYWMIPARFADPAVYIAAVGIAGQQRREATHAT